jgi:acyl carrier protein
LNNLETEIKQLIIDTLNLEDVKLADIASDEPLFVEGLGLDSIDALELGMVLQKKYNIKLQVTNNEAKKHFYSVKTIAQYVLLQNTGASNE